MNKQQIIKVLPLAKKVLRPKILGATFLVLTLTFIGLYIYKYLDSQGGDPVSGKEAYLTYCVSCHGDKGYGDGLAASALPHPPRNLYRRLTDIVTYDSFLIRGPIMNGRVNRGMPAFKEIVTEEKAKDIFAYIRSINE